MKLEQFTTEEASSLQCSNVLSFLSLDKVGSIWKSVMVVSMKYKKDSIGVLLTFLSIYVTDPINLIL